MLGLVCTAMRSASLIVNGADSAAPPESPIQLAINSEWKIRRLFIPRPFDLARKYYLQRKRCITLSISGRKRYAIQTHMGPVKNPAFVAPYLLSLLKNLLVVPPANTTSGREQY